MIKIRSTQKLATSNSDGLCDMQRTLSNFRVDIEKQTVSTIVQDKLFQEQDFTVDITETDSEGVETTTPVTTTERKYVNTKQATAYSYSFAEIDGFYDQLGSDITKATGFTTGILENLVTVLIAQTSFYERQTMSNWILDNSEHVEVRQFTVITQA